MGVYNDIAAAVKQALILNEKVENTGRVLNQVAAELRDHDRRIVRLETLVELGVGQHKRVSEKE